MVNKFSIVIPLFNEELNLDLLVGEIFLHLEIYNNQYEIILVNDGSTDQTKSRIKYLKEKSPNIIRSIENIKNIGQSYSLIEGISFSKFATIVVIDGDGQNNPKDIPILLKKYFSDENLFLVGGIRHKRKDSFVKIFSSKLANIVRNFLLKDNCSDTGCSLKVFNKDIFLKFPTFNGIHRFLPALFTGYGVKTFFIKVDHRHRVYGYSKYGTFGRLFKGLRDLIKVAKIIKEFKRNRV